MQPVNKLLKLLWFSTFLIFMVSVISAYYYLNDQVAVMFDRLGAPSEFLEKSDFYFWVTLIFVSINVLVSFVISKLEKLPLYKNKAFEDKDALDSARYNLSSYMYGMGLCINFSIVSLLVILWYANFDLYLNDFAFKCALFLLLIAVILFPLMIVNKVNSISKSLK